MIQARQMAVTIRRAEFALQGGKLDDITVVMAIVDEEDVHVVHAELPESEEEDDVETLVSDSEAVSAAEPVATSARVI